MAQYNLSKMTIAQAWEVADMWYRRSVSLKIASNDKRLSNAKRMRIVDIMLENSGRTWSLAHDTKQRESDAVNQAPFAPGGIVHGSSGNVHTGGETSIPKNKYNL